ERPGMSGLRRFLRRLTEGDEERLAAELRTWAATVPGTVRIDEAAPRSRVSVAGMVRRITVRPVEGFEALEVVLSDGTGEVAVRPLCHLTSATHTAPLRLSFSVQDVRTGQLSDLLRDGGVDEVVTSVQKGLAARLVGLALRALGVALAGAIAVAVLVYRKQ